MPLPNSSQARIGAAAATNGFSLGVMVVPFCSVVFETHDEMDRQDVTCGGKMFSQPAVHFKGL
jgi:hypothetical protein